MIYGLPLFSKRMQINQFTIYSVINKYFFFLRKHTYWTVFNLELRLTKPGYKMSISILI
jgi:hypothetical protein